MCSEGVRERLLRVLGKGGLPTALDFNVEKVLAAMEHDTNVVEAGNITVTNVNEARKFELVTMPVSELKEKVRGSLGK